MIRIKDLWKTYPGSSKPALRGVTFDIPARSFFTLLGPSGCGKTTLLRCIAGLEGPDSGEIVLDDKVVYSSTHSINIPTYRRRIGMVFQSYAIWPHMTVRANVEYPLRHRKDSRGRSARDAAMDTLRLVGMERYAEQSATQLSGGEQQRVAVARALVQDPDVLLLDEPLSNLDAKLRDMMRLELQDIQRSLDVTTIYVTHDQEEAYSLSDQMAVMSEGRPAEIGVPSDVYETPTTKFGADFLGNSTRLEGTVHSLQGSTVVVHTRIGLLPCRTRSNFAPGNSVYVYLRPVDVRPVLPGELVSSNRTKIKAKPVRTIFLGSYTEWLAEAEGTLLRGRSMSFSEEARFVDEADGVEIELSLGVGVCISATP